MDIVYKWTERTTDQDPTVLITLMVKVNDTTFCDHARIAKLELELAHDPGRIKQHVKDELKHRVARYITNYIMESVEQ
uniref:Uncharacterized protein n=1 Tax=feces metagenome TaxID=1861841 RepID=A0A7M2QP71_9ZZZZ